MQGAGWLPREAVQQEQRSACQPLTWGSRPPVRSRCPMTSRATLAATPALLLARPYADER
jgi:hypothetical protein